MLVAMCSSKGPAKELNILTMCGGIGIRYSQGLTGLPYSPRVTLEKKS
jgi:hypothetical protein